MHDFEKPRQGEGGPSPNLIGDGSRVLENEGFPVNIRSFIVFLNLGLSITPYSKIFIVLDYSLTEEEREPRMPAGWLVRPSRLLPGSEHFAGPTWWTPRPCPHP